MVAHASLASFLVDFLIMDDELVEPIPLGNCIEQLQVWSFLQEAKAAITSTAEIIIEIFFILLTLGLQIISKARC